MLYLRLLKFYYRQQEERERQAQLRGAPTMDPDIAATKIQKVIIMF